MATNVEIKARITDLKSLKNQAERISDSPAELIFQEDVFFHGPRGRLKLRIFSDDRGELIYYERADQAGPKRSQYFISGTAEPRKLVVVLEAAMGIRGVVRKRRWLYWVDNTRIHLDEVEGLGSFVELEVMLSTGQRTEEGEATAGRLMATLGIDDSDLIEGAYIDLLEGEGRPGVYDG
ncbi:MAG: class IV adenylate cyclase [Candidatus Promineifilaceae bacterium]